MIKVVGHRGAAGLYPENTRKGFCHAIKLGVDYIECDVHLTFDHHLIVMHDATIDRTTNGTGSIQNLTLKTMRALNAGDGQHVPTFDEVLDLVTDQFTLLCELKGANTEEKAIESVCTKGLENNVIFTSFHMPRIEKVKHINPQLKTGAILPNPSEDDIKRAADLGATNIDVNFKNVCYRIVNQAVKYNLGLIAWNPDTLAEQQAMIALGISTISTNRPDILLDYLRQNGQHL